MGSNKENVGSVPHECFYRCNWPEHSSNLTAALTKASLTDEKVAAYLKWCCVRYPQALDSDGRTLVHVAASKGRLKLLHFLLNHQDVNINAKDKESLYTALHRSLFYGQLHCSVRLIQRGASLQQTDADDLTPLDHVMKDRPKILEYNLHHPCEVYVWGTNTNYTLGIGHHHSRSNPEPLASFRKPCTSIKQVAMDKFHSVFVGSNGQVWSCGHGLGGRLGLDDESTALVPKPLKSSGGNSKSDACSAVSIGTDHTVLLMENGSVWTCGLNKYHQLGHNPPPEKVLSPRQVKGLKGADAVGVSASRFHTCFWTKNQLFTCGLHGGQLGHLKGDATVAAPKLVTAVQLKDSTIEHVATSEGATVLVNNKGDVFLLHEYQCKKLTPRNKPLKARQVCAIGGHLDHKTCAADLKEKGGDELKILLLESGTNKLYLWQESCSPQFTRCIFSLKRQIQLTDVFLNRFSVLITTADGEAFQGEIRTKKKKAVPVEPVKTASPKSTFHDFVDKDECEYVKLKRIPHIHRAVKVTSDSRGRNFAAIQVHPKSGLLAVPFVESTEMSQNMKTLLETADLCDSVHDSVFEVGPVKYPVHRYVMAHASNVFEDMLDKATSVDGSRLVKISDVQPEIFRRILEFVYTNDCDLLRPDVSSVSWEPVDSAIKADESEETIDEEAVSAYESARKKAVAKKKKTPKPSFTNDPVKLLRDAAKKFGLTTLLKRLQLVKYEKGSVVYTSQRRFVPDGIKFDRKNLQDLWDVTLKSSDNVEIKAHKCILTARLEYFNCLINQGWLESSQKSALKIPIPVRILEILIRHMYTDDAPELANGEDGDLASLVLVFADQYLCARLKEYAETCLANLLTLRNAVEMLQMAETYNAPQLKQCTMEFICLNLPALLESRSLEVLDDSVLSELRDFYRSWLPCMSRRHVSTQAAAPDDDLVDLVYAGEPVVLDSVSEETLPNQKTPKVPKKFKSKDKKSTESGRTRNASVGSLTSDEESAVLAGSPGLGARTDEEGWVKVTNHPSKQQRIVQTRLKVAMEAAETPSTPVRFTKLVSDRTPRVAENKSEKKIPNMISPSEKDFPSLNASPSERISATPPMPKSSSAETCKKFTRLSQKQRKRLATLSLSEDEESPKSPDIAIKSAWGIPKNDSLPLSEITRQKNMEIDLEFGRNEIGIASSPPWTESTFKDPSLSAIMAAEKHERNLINKLKSKPLAYTQMEDKAMEDLFLLYDVKNVTDEKITVRRAETVFISPPVWVSSHR